VRLVFEHQSENPSQWAAICWIAAKFGIWHETLRNWCGGPRPMRGCGPA
jgi:transposase